VSNTCFTPDSHLLYACVAPARYDTAFALLEISFGDGLADAIQQVALYTGAYTCLTPADGLSRGLADAIQQVALYTCAYTCFTPARGLSRGLADAIQQVARTIYTCFTPP
jgi:hypothetical protein